jgi:hypothetical protein
VIQVENYCYRQVQLTADNWCLPNSSAGAAGGGNSAGSAIEPWAPSPEIAGQLPLLNKTISVHLYGPDKAPTVATVVVSTDRLSRFRSGHM